MRDAVSAGGVVFRAEGGRWLIVLVRVAGGRWTIPKGLLESGETERRAALREVREETGLETEIVAKLGEIDYWFYWRPERVRYHKFVHFFLMRHMGGSTADHDAEVDEVCWFALAEALRAVTYRTERDMLQKAQTMLAGMGSSDKG